MSNTSEQSLKQKYSREVIRLLQDSENAKSHNKYQEAITLAEKALVIEPTCYEALEEIADNSLFLNEITKAEKASIFVIELYPKSDTAHYILGFINIQKRKFHKAIDHLEQANQFQANNPEILRSLGWAYFMAEKDLKGIVILERALNLQHDDPLILCDLGVCYMKNDQLKKSLDLFYRAIEVDPNDERVRDCIRVAEKMMDDIKSEKKGKNANGEKKMVIK